MTTPFLLAVVAAAGAYYVYTAFALGWRGFGLGPRPIPHRRSAGRMHEWMVQAGLGDVRARDFVAAMAALFLAGSVVTYALLGGAVPAVAVGLCAAAAPITSYRAKRTSRRALAQEAWPRLIEEIRILTGSVGRSIPQALFEAGRRAPEEMQPAFRAAHREWLISTDFERTLRVLKAGLADPTADVTCETLLVAHAVGGSDLDRRLEALAEDRIQDTQGRKDARAKQAGARFSRRFVLFAPVGMALAGMSVGNGRAAFRSATGQLLSLVAVGLVVVCWIWAGQVLKLPEEERVFQR